MDLGILTSKIAGYFRRRPKKSQRTSRFVPGDTTEKWLCTYARSQADGLKLLSYNVQKLVKWGAFSSLFVQGTVLTMDSTMCLTLLKQGVIACIAGSTILLDSDFSEKDIQGIDNLSHYLGSFTPFALGMYIALAISRWWSLRTDALAPVYNATANICMLLLGALPNLSRYNDLKGQVLKYGMCSVRLMVLAARNQDDLLEMHERGLLDEEECEIVKSMDLYPRAMVMWAWIMRLCFHAFEECRIPDGVFNNVAKECIDARNGIQTIHTYCKTQLPLAYVHLILLIVNLNNIVVSVKSGLLVAVAVRNYWNGSAEGQDFWQIVVNITWWLTATVVYEGLLAISYVVHDPFGEDILDFPVANFSDYVYQTCEAMYINGHCPSEPELFASSSRVQEVIQEMNMLGLTASTTMRQTLANWVSRLSTSSQASFSHDDGSDPHLPEVDDATDSQSLSSKRASCTILESESNTEVAEEFIMAELMPLVTGLTGLLRDLDSKLPDASAVSTARERVERQHAFMTKQRAHNETERRKLRNILENERKSRKEGLSACVSVERCQSSGVAQQRPSDAVKDNIVEACSF